MRRSTGCWRRARTLTLGDFCPKNSFVYGDRMLALDFEVAHWGDPGFDVAFCLNHLLLKALRFREWSPSYVAAARGFWSSYAVVAPGVDETELAAARELGVLMLARIDGKSPVEYITDEATKALVREHGDAADHGRSRTGWSRCSARWSARSAAARWCCERRRADHRASRRARCSTRAAARPSRRGARSRAAPPARASVPSGASTGRHEAVSCATATPTATAGLGVAPRGRQRRRRDRPGARGRRRGRPGGGRRAPGGAGRHAREATRLGANAILAVSLAVARAAAARARACRCGAASPASAPPLLPLPMVNMLSAAACTPAANSTSRTSWSCRWARATSRGAGAGRERCTAPRASCCARAACDAAGRRGRLRAVADGERGALRICRRERSSAPASRRATTSRIALDVAATHFFDPRPVATRCARGPRAGRRRAGGAVRRWADELPDRVDRGPAGRGRLGRLGEVTRALGELAAAGRRRPLHDEPERVERGIERAPRTRCS